MANDPRAPLVGVQHLPPRFIQHEQQPNALLNDLLGTDVIFGEVIPSFDWPNPVWKIYPQELRTSVNTTFILAGTDRYLVSGLGPRYDYPNPVPKTYSDELRTTVWNGLETTLNQQRIPFQLSNLMDHQVRAVYPVSLRTHVFYYVNDVSNPPQNPDWPNPVLKPYSHDLRSWVTPRILGTSQVRPTIPPDYQNPVRVGYSSDFRTGISGSAAIASTQAPFHQHDWPSAKPLPFPIDLLSWTSRVLRGDPFKQTEWLNPTSKGYPVDIVSYILQSLNLPGLAATKPFPSQDLSYPYRVIFQDKTKVKSSYYNVDITIPFEPVDWQNPVPEFYPLDLRSTFSTSLAAGVVVFPFSQDDWQNPQSSQFPLDSRTSLAVSRAILIEVPPFNQTVWPNPISSTYANDLRTGIILGYISVTPFKQTDWQNPAWAPYPRDLRSYVQQPQNFPGPGPKPFLQSVWPNPKDKFYHIDLRTLLNAGYKIIPVFYSAAPCDTFSVDQDTDFIVVADDDFKVTDC